MKRKILQLSTLVLLGFTLVLSINSFSQQISAGTNHVTVLCEDGKVLTWGLNEDGQLGFASQGPGTYSATPYEVTGLNDIIAVASGGSHTLALKNDGTVWAWGRNSNGQLGLGNTNSTHTPTVVPGITNAVAIAAGSVNSAIVKSDGTVWTCGYGQLGANGNGSNAQQTSFVQVSNLTNVDTVSIGYAHMLALKNDGTVWAWGYGLDGQLGNNDYSTSNVPVQTNGLSNVKKIIARNDFSVAQNTDGTIRVWGYFSDNYQSSGPSTPSEISDEPIPEFVDAGQNFIVFKYIGDGWATAFGSNNQGQLSDGTIIGNWVDVYCGGYYSIIKDNNGNLFGWGYNNYGQLGSNNIGNQIFTPIAVNIGCGGAPEMTVSSSNLSAFDQVLGTPSPEQSFTVEGTDLTANITVTAPTNYEVSLTSGSGFASSVQVNQTSGTATATTIYVRLNAAAVGAHNGDVTLTSGALSETVAVSGTTTQNTANLNENYLNNLSIFPNPGSGMVVLSVSQPTTAVLMGVNGAVLANFELHNKTTIDVSTYSSGIYFFRTAEGQTVKFVKQ